jgi:hypothetical protein
MQPDGVLQMSAALRLFDLIQSHRITAVIYVAARLGIAELLRDGPKPLAELVRHTGANEEGLRRLLAALTTVEVCIRTSSDQYALTEVGRHLDGSADQSFKGWAIFEGEMLSKSWTGMLETIMTGKTAAQLQGLSNSFDLMMRTPANVDIFNAAMADLTRLVTPVVLRAYDFADISHLMDVGGGSGEVIGAVMQKYPQILGTVLDLPRCAEAARSHFTSLGIAGRARFVAGDFFVTVPAIADAIILKSVIHDWDDERSGLILRNCHQALPETGRIILVERIIPESLGVSDEDRAHAMSDLNMLRGPGGRERTEQEYHRLLLENGFLPTSTCPAGRFSLIEARVNS